METGPTLADIATDVLPNPNAPHDIATETEIATAYALVSIARSLERIVKALGGDGLRVVNVR